MTGTNKRSR